MAAVERKQRLASRVYRHTIQILEKYRGWTINKDRLEREISGTTTKGAPFVCVFIPESAHTESTIKAYILNALKDICDCHLFIVFESKAVMNSAIGQSFLAETCWKELQTPCDVELWCYEDLYVDILQNGLQPFSWKVLSKEQVEELVVKFNLPLELWPSFTPSCPIVRLFGLKLGEALKTEHAHPTAAVETQYRVLRA